MITLVLPYVCEVNKSRVLCHLGTFSLFLFPSFLQDCALVWFMASVCICPHISDSSLLHPPVDTAKCLLPLSSWTDLHYMFFEITCFVFLLPLCECRPWVFTPVLSLPVFVVLMRFWGPGNHLHFLHSKHWNFSLQFIKLISTYLYIYSHFKVWDLEIYKYLCLDCWISQFFHFFKQNKLTFRINKYKWILRVVTM